jgi:hypothetical protein
LKAIKRDLEEGKMRNAFLRNLVDWLVANGGTSPGWEQRAAEHFKVSVSWIAMVTSADAFQDYYHRRTR